MLDLKKLYVEIHDRLWLKALSILKNEDDASDVIQEVFYKLCEMNKAEQDKMESPKSYLWRMVQNRSFDVIKKRKNEVDTNVLYSVHSSSREYDKFELQDFLEFIESLLVFNVEEQKVWAEMKQGLPNREIAEETGIKVDKIRKIRFTIKRRIQNKLKVKSR